MEISSDDDAFDEGEWRRCKKIFDKAPYSVRMAYERTIALSEAFYDDLLPRPSSSVLDLVSCRTMPELATALVTVPPAHFFSSDPPTLPLNLSTVRHWHAPPTASISAIIRAAPQAWLDGAESIVYAHNGSKLRFPLTIVGFWAELSTAHAQRDSWTASLTWLTLPRVSAKVDDILLIECHRLLSALPWHGSTVSFGRAVSPIVQLTRLLSDQWLSNFTIELVMEYLSFRVSPNVRLESPLFSQDLYNSYASLKPSKNLKAIGESLASARCQRLFAVVHNHTFGNLWTANGKPEAVNHWCSISIHWPTRSIDYYDSLGKPMPEKLRKALQWWIGTWSSSRLTFDSSDFGGNSQTDNVSCGLFAMNVVEHFATQNTPLLVQAQVLATRVRLFNSLAQLRLQLI